MHPDQENLSTAPRKRTLPKGFVKEVAFLTVVCAVWWLLFYFVFPEDHNPVTLALSGAVTVGVLAAARWSWGGLRARAGRRGTHAG